MSDLGPQTDGQLAAPLFDGVDQAAQEVAPVRELPFKVSGEESIRSSWEQGIAGRSSMALERVYNMWQANDQKDAGPRLTPEKLNEMYKDSGHVFNEPLTARAAQLTIDRAQEDQALSRISEAGPDGFAYGAAKFGAGIISSSLDPLDFAAGVATGGIFNAVIKSSKYLKRFGLAEKIAQQTLTKGEKFGVNVAEGTIGNIALEPAQYAAQTAEGQDYDAAQGFINSVGGAIGFAGLRFGAEHIATRGTQLFDHLSGREDRLHESMQRTSVAQTINDEHVRVDSYVKDAAKAIDHSVEMHGEYRFEPKTEEQLKEKPLYMAADRPSTHFDSVNSKPFTQNFGEGVYLTDAEHVANGTASSKFSDSNGNIVSVEVNKDLKTIDLNEPVPSNMKTNIETAVGRAINPDETLSSLLNEIQVKNNELGIKESAKDTLKNFSQIAGYDGYRFKEDNLAGEKVAPHNQVYVFPESKDKLLAKEFKPSDPTKTNGLSNEDIRQNYDNSKDPNRKLDYDQKIHEEVQKYSQEALPDVNEREARTQYEEHLAELDDMDKQGLLEPEQKAQLEMLKQEAAKDKDTESLIQMARNCLLGK